MRRAVLADTCSGMDMSRYTIVSQPTDGVIVTEHDEFGKQVWGACRITYKHQRDTCELCGRTVGTSGYRPLTNKYNRMKRFCSYHRLADR